MTRIRIYRNPDCTKCARWARMHLFFDWFRQVVVSTATPPGSGPLAMDEVVVQDLDSGRLLRGAEALDCICRRIPVYAPLRLFLRIPVVRRRVDQKMAGRVSEATAPAKKKMLIAARKWR